MKLLRVLASLAMLAGTAAAADFPSAEISNGPVTAKFYLPDAENGYYRATRFEWSGVIHSLRVDGREYFGQWFPKYDPKLHDAIQGPVEEFRTNNAGLGYDEAKVGEPFIRIGVGTVRKPDEPHYQNFRTYDILDNGKWTVRKGKDWIEFTHDLTGPNGYAYHYVKTIRLASGKPGMTIEHTLKNTGTKPIPTQQYNHNFFVMDNQPTGPAASVRFPFNLASAKPVDPELAEVKGGLISYKRDLQKGESVFSEFTGFGQTAADYDIRIENKAAGSGVRIQGDRPIAKLVFWSIRTTLCPEAYIDILVEPGSEQKWTYTYTFYPVSK
jgi:hypothetical protein